jgi:hypothetical protein
VNKNTNVNNCGSCNSVTFPASAAVPLRCQLGSLQRLGQLRRQRDERL